MGTAETLKAAATGQITTREARNPFDALSMQLETRTDEFAKMLGSRANAEAFIRVVKNAVAANPELLNVTRQSLLLASMRAAQDGLMPDGREAVLNIYNVKVKGPNGDYWEKRAQYLPMVGGLIKLMYASGEITYVDGAVAYERDLFKFRRGDNPGIDHEPYDGDEDPGPVKAAYVIVKLKNGEVKREVMFRRDIEQVRNASKSKDSGPWKDWYDQQSIKSVIKRVWKQLPKIDRLERAIAHDNDEMHGSLTGQVGMGELIPQRDTAGAPAPTPAPAPALENSPSETLEGLTGMVGTQLDQMAQDVSTVLSDPQERQEEQHQQQAGEQSQDTPQQQLEPDGQPGAQMQVEPMKPTYAQLAMRLRRTNDKEVGLLVLDEARSCDLTPKQLTDLQAIFDAKFSPPAAG